MVFGQELLGRPHLPYHCTADRFNKSGQCCEECQCLISSLLHRKHMGFAPELNKRRHCSYHRQFSMRGLCCAECRRLNNSRHHRKQMYFGQQELIKSQSSPLHRCCAQTRQCYNCFLHTKHMCFGRDCFIVASRHNIIILEHNAWSYFRLIRVNHKKF
jgi:hypothetical protein